ncbi:hypothetical protein SRHO_G00102200 [Serrasalmus rhombeus]
MTPLQVPLHQIHLASKLVSDDVVVGVRQSLPVPGVSFILGNDLAGGKVWGNTEVVPPPIVVSVPKYSNKADQCFQKHPHVFSACAVTRAMAKHGDLSVNSLSLEDTFLATPEGVDCSPSRSSVGDMQSDDPGSPSDSSDCLEVVAKVDVVQPVEVGSNTFPATSVCADEIDRPVSELFKVSREELIKEQGTDSTLQPLFALAEAEDKIGGGVAGYFMQDIPTRTSLVEHDIDVAGALPIRQHAYRVNPTKRELLRREVDYLIANNLAEPSFSAWSSPCLLVDKPDANLTINLAKCEFGKARVTYLGKVVGGGQVRPVEAKVEAVCNFPVPGTRRELRRFLGMAGYYRAFCKNFASVTAPLTNLLSPKVQFQWSNSCQEAFDNAKLLLATSPVLQAPNFDKPFCLAVDASESGAGAVLLQCDLNSVEHPVCYYSKKFNRHQQAYSTVEREALALILAIQHFEVYLGSSSTLITVYTDHNPLVFIDRMRNQNQCIMRWSLILQHYPLKIQHIRGRDNIIADALSRA